MLLVLRETETIRHGRGERLNIAPSGKRYRCYFIEPGLVNYGDVGGDTELLRKETIERDLQTLIGCPLTKGHISLRNNSRAVQHGCVDKVGYDASTGWFFCEGPLDTDEARALIRKNAKPSVGYKVTSFGVGGIHHNITFAREITGIKFHHLALVDNPRYEGADIRLNSKTQEKPAMFKWIRKVLRPAAEAGGQETTVEEKGEIAPDATLEVNGQPVRLNDLVELKRTTDAKAVADAKTAKEAALKTDPADAERENGISGEDEIEVDGKPVRVNDLVKLYQDSTRANSTAETAEAKAAREAKEKAERDAAQATRENAGPRHFKVLGSARNTPPPIATERVNSAGSLSEQVALGASRYGTPSKN